MVLLYIVVIYATCFLFWNKNITIQFYSFLSNFYPFSSVGKKIWSILPTYYRTAIWAADSFVLFFPTDCLCCIHNAARNLCFHHVNWPQKYFSWVQSDLAFSVRFWMVLNTFNKWWTCNNRSIWNLLDSIIVTQVQSNEKLQFWTAKTNIQS